MLIPSQRHRAEDLDLWRELEACDRAAASHRSLSKLAASAIETAIGFMKKGPAYTGVSWGKDSVVAADICARASRLAGVPCPPLVWVRVEPIANPECAAVRDAYLQANPRTNYLEITERCEWDADGWHATGTLEAGFQRAVELVGARRYISGIRADESGIRTISGRTHGMATARCCRPLLRWRAEHIFAWLARHDLPVHPAYAMLGNGRWNRERIRVASLGGRRGDGFGRSEWEAEYYGDVLNRLAARPQCP